MNNNNEIFEKLLKIRTSNQWSLLSSISRKIHIAENELIKYLKSVNKEILEKSGIWVQKTGKTYIMCTNPACRMAKENNNECICKVKNDVSTERYFNSYDYNAGRHSRENVSKHQPACQFWNPPSSGHLQSWRRGY